MGRPQRASTVSLPCTFCEKHQVGPQRGEQGTDGEGWSEGVAKCQNGEKDENSRISIILGLNYFIHLLTVLQAEMQSKQKSSCKSHLTASIMATAEIICLYNKTATKSYFMNVTLIYL